MDINNASVKENIKFDPIDNSNVNWYSVEGYRRFGAIAQLIDAEIGEGVSIQLRKATDSGGTGATNHGSAITYVATANGEDVCAVAEDMVADLGDNGSGVQYTHVSITLAKLESPTVAETISAIMFRAWPRFAPVGNVGS